MKGFEAQIWAEGLKFLSKDFKEFEFFSLYSAEYQ